MFFINPFIYAGGGDFESIATVTVGSGGASSIEFTSIPSTFQHLQIRYTADTDWAGTIQALIIEYNGATSTYRGHEIAGSGAAATAGNFTFAACGGVGGTSYSTNVFAAGIIDILDYASATKATVSRSLSGIDSNGSGFVLLQSGLWTTTDAVTSIKIRPQVSSNFIQHSTFALYGVRA